MHELDNEAEAIIDELSELYTMLEIGKITKEEFKAREKGLLDRLDEIDRQIHIKDEDEKDEE